MKDNRTVAEKKEQFLAELAKCMAIISMACKRCDIGRTMLYEYIKNDIVFAEKVYELEEAAVDFAESKLAEKVVEGDRASVMFFLKAKGRKRGYH